MSLPRYPSSTPSRAAYRGSWYRRPSVITRRGGLVRGGVGDEFRPRRRWDCGNTRHSVGRFRGERGDTLQLPFPYVVDVEYHQLVVTGDVRSSVSGKVV